MANVFERYPLFMTEGSIIELIKRRGTYPLDYYITNTPMIYDEQGRQILSTIYKKYIEISLQHELPIILLTPTWRANKEYLDIKEMASVRVNADAFNFLAAIRDNYQTDMNKILIGGMLGPKGDAYTAVDALTTSQSYEFHSWQVERLSDSGVDFLIASTIPSVTEAAGIAKACAWHAIPYVISFYVLPDGCLPDGTSLGDAITTIDESLDNKPSMYWVNCVHPANFRKAITAEVNEGISALARIKGLQANASDKSPMELEQLELVDSGQPDIWAEEMSKIKDDFNMTVLGGCCGTDYEHHEKLADKMNLADEGSEFLISFDGL
jgi:homocysteine S-methyltransferase